MAFRDTLKIFKQKARKPHGYKYSYSKFVYIDSQTKGIIICKKHGDFEQTPSSHLYGRGCPKCCGNIRLTLKQFTDKGNTVHNFKYDYSKFIYVNNGTKGIIICKKHGEFAQQPNNHLEGNGCPHCVGRGKTTKSFIKECESKHGIGRYDYSKVKYVHIKDKIKIICPLKNHGEFLQKADNHLQGKGCSKCAKNFKYDTKSFIEIAKLKHPKKNYDYSKFIYVNSGTKGIIICSYHGNFELTASGHLSGTGCALCSSNKRTNEKIVKKFLEENDIIFQEQCHVKLPINKRYSLIDFYVPHLNLFIEYNGRQHYEPSTFGRLTQEEAEEKLKKDKKRDRQLRKYCKKNNINLLEIDGRKYFGGKLVNYLKKYFIK